MMNIYKFLYNKYGHIFSIIIETNEKNGNKKYLMVDFCEYIYKDQKREVKEFLHNVVESLKENFKKYNFNSCELSYKEAPELIHYAIEVERKKSK